MFLEAVIMSSRTLLPILPLLLSFAMEVIADSTPAVCLPGWEWNQNSLGQDPCSIGTMLNRYCRNQPNFPDYPKVNPGEYYIPPRKAHAGDLDCECDTVMYSLTMACSTCQNSIAYGWDVWIKQCDTVLISNYSGEIPPGTAIPHWAFYNVTLLDNQVFTDSQARSTGRDPEAKAPPPKESHSKGMSKKTAYMICGVVGGVCFLVLISIAVYFGLRWQLRNKEKKLLRQWDHSGGYDSWRKPVLPPPAQATQNPSFSTGPTLVSNLSFQPYVPPEDRSNPTTTTD